MDKEPSENAMIMEALDKAIEAFQAHIESYSCDPAYWDFRFTVWALDCEFDKRLEKIEIEREVKE